RDVRGEGGRGRVGGRAEPDVRRKGGGPGRRCGDHVRRRPPRALDRERRARVGRALVSRLRVPIRPEGAGNRQPPAMTAGSSDAWPGFGTRIVNTTTHDYPTHDYLPDVGDTNADDTLYPAQATLLRCIVANPFRPVSLNPAWLTSDVVRLAHAAYQVAAL